MKRLLFCAVIGPLMSFGYDASTITSVDWSAQGEGATYTVPAGVTNLVTEADIAKVNALGKIVFGDKGSALLFTSTTAPAVLFSGAGTVIKEGAAAWTLSKVQTDTTFRGNWDLREGRLAVGAVNGNNSTLFPVLSSWRTCTVRKGATFVYDVSANFQCVQFRLAGTLEVKANSTSLSFQSIVLDDDAVIDQPGSNYIFFSRLADDGQPAVELNGYKLTCKLATHIYLFRGTIAGPGTFRLENVTNQTKSFGLYVRGDGVRGFTDDSVRFELGHMTDFNIQSHPSKPQVATLVVEGTSVFGHSHIPAAQTCPDDGEGLFWDGPVVLANATSLLRVNNALATSETVSAETIQAQIGLRGKVSGPGALQFATSPSYANGTYYLTNAANDFTGSLTLNSRAGVLYKLTGTAQEFAAMNLANVGVDWTLVPSEPLVRATKDIKEDAYYTKDDVNSRLKVGDRVNGKLTIVDGVSITERLCLSSYASVDNTRTRGVIRQTGGELSLIGQYLDGNHTYSSVLGNWGQGGYSLEGGTLTFLGHCCGANYGNLVFHQSGGTLKTEKYPWGTQASEPTFSVGLNSGAADLIFTGGTADFGQCLTLSRVGNAASAPQTCSSLTVAGSAEVSVLNLTSGTKAECVANVNLRGGRFSAQWSPQVDVDTWLFFDGGVFALRRDLYRGEFGGNDASHAPAKLRVGPQGGTLDVQGYYQHNWVPFVAEGDGTVTEIPWTDTKTVFLAPPTVVISGAGRHATAYADYDYEKGTIRRIIVTCGGEGYVAGETTAQLEYQANRAYAGVHQELLAEPIACTVGNVTSGGMTFRATGCAEGSSNYIAQHGTSTYEGPTTVDMQTDATTEVPGVLSLWDDDMFPNSSKLIVKSGKLDFNKHAQSFTELEMSGGTLATYPAGTGMTLDQASFSGASDLGYVAMTVKKLVIDAANPPMLANARITAAENGTLAVTNAAALAGLERGKVLFSAPVTGAANLTLEQPADLPENLALRWSDGVLRVSRTDVGFAVFVR